MTDIEQVTHDRISFAGGVLDPYRHVCAFVNSRDEEHLILDPFVSEGLAHGDKLLDIVDPAQRASLVHHLRRLGLDMPQLLERASAKCAPGRRRIFGGLGFAVAPGVTASFIPTLEDATALFRSRFAPGASYEEDPTPVVRLIYGEVGTLHPRLDLPVAVVRAGATDAPGESIAADTEFILNAGDSTVYPPNVRKIMRNDGEEPAQVAVAQLDPGHLAASLMATSGQ